MSFSGADQKLLEKIHRHFLSLEKGSRDGAFDSDLLADLKELLEQCQTSESLDVQRISEITPHLHAGMTLAHFIGFLVPVERLLRKNLRDDEFVVTSLDHGKAATEKLPLVFVLDNIRSAFNVGSIFRTAECLNIEAVYLCGYTPTPEQEKVDKTAMGTEDHVQWQSFRNVEAALKELKSRAYRIAALETADKGLDLYQDFLFQPTALVFGNERFGLDRQILSLVDEVRMVPLRGQKNSLNVGVTAAVAGFEWTRQWNQKK